MDKKKVGLLIAGAGALYLLTKKGGPTFYDMQGRVITTIICGGSMSFDVPGYPRVWMTQLKDGTLHYDGMFELPMPAYVVNCVNDVGAYDIAVYEVDANDVKGKLIGQTQFTILPQPAQ